jgi:hypothetical protein
VVSHGACRETRPICSQYVVLALVWSSKRHMLAIAATMFFSLAGALSWAKASNDPWNGWTLVPTASVTWAPARGFDFTQEAQSRAAASPAW